MGCGIVRKLHGKCKDLWFHLNCPLTIVNSSKQNRIISFRLTLFRFHLFFVHAEGL